ncbi:MAG: aquaporin Z, partial [Terriglobales bacterium]
MQRYTAELIGTFVLVFGGLGSAVLAGGQIGYLGISLAFGLALLVMCYAIGPVSGCHINPAVTLGVLAAKRISARDALGYWIAQILGAIIAAGLVLVIANGAAGGYSAALSGLGANGFGLHSPGHFGLGAALLSEVILTAFLVFTVLGATDFKAPAGFAGLAIGLVLTLTNLVAIPVDNASINPARSIGPALFVGGWALSQLWVFIAAPLAGGLLAAVAYALVRPSDSAISRPEAGRSVPAQE